MDSKRAGEKTRNFERNLRDIKRWKRQFKNATELVFVHYVPDDEKDKDRLWNLGIPSIR